MNTWLPCGKKYWNKLETRVNNQIGWENLAHLWRNYIVGTNMETNIENNMDTDIDAHLEAN